MFKPRSSHLDVAKKTEIYEAVVSLAFDSTKYKNLLARSDFSTIAKSPDLGLALMWLLNSPPEEVLSNPVPFHMFGQLSLSTFYPYLPVDGEPSQDWSDRLLRLQTFGTYTMDNSIMKLLDIDSSEIEVTPATVAVYHNSVANYASLIRLGTEVSFFNYVVAILTYNNEVLSHMFATELMNPRVCAGLGIVPSMFNKLMHACTLVDNDVALKILTGHPMYPEAMGKVGMSECREGTLGHYICYNDSWRCAGVQIEYLEKYYDTSVERTLQLADLVESGGQGEEEDEEDEEDETDSEDESGESSDTSSAEFIQEIEEDENGNVEYTIYQEQDEEEEEEENIVPINTTHKPKLEKLSMFKNSRFVKKTDGKTESAELLYREIVAYLTGSVELSDRKKVGEYLASIINHVTSKLLESGQICNGRYLEYINPA